MMKDFNGNTRTLIVSFVVAIMFLIPLRFVEVGSQVAEVPNANVLGVSTVAKKNVILPNAAIKSDSVLEAPYNEIEAGCSEKDALLKKLGTGNLTQAEVDQTVAKLNSLNKVCK